MPYDLMGEDRCRWEQAEGSKRGRGEVEVRVLTLSWGSLSDHYVSSLHTNTHTVKRLIKVNEFMPGVSWTLISKHCQNSSAYYYRFEGQIQAENIFFFSCSLSNFTSWNSNNRLLFLLYGLYGYSYVILVFKNSWTLWVVYVCVGAYVSTFNTVIFFAAVLTVKCDVNLK